MIQLDKILKDIEVEKCLNPNYPEPNDKKSITDAWARVAGKNSLSAHEVRSIFRVLQKKYEQEKQKAKSTWKLFSIMESIHAIPENELRDEMIDDPNLPPEEDEEYEMFDVQDEDEPPDSLPMSPSSSSASTSAHASNESLITKSIKIEKLENGADNLKQRSISPDRDEHPQRKETQNINNSSTIQCSKQTQQQQQDNVVSSNASSTENFQKPKHGNAVNATTPAVASHKKGFTIIKSGSPLPNNNTPNMKGKPKVLNSMTSSNAISSSVGQSGRGSSSAQVRKIQLPETIKRKLSEESNIRVSTSPPNKKLASMENTKTAVSVKPLLISEESRNHEGRHEAANHGNEQNLSVSKDIKTEKLDTDELAIGITKSQSTGSGNGSSVSTSSGLDSKVCMTTASNGISLITIPGNAMEHTTTSNGFNNALNGPISQYANVPTTGSNNNGMDLQNSIILDSSACSEVLNRSLISARPSINESEKLCKINSGATATTSDIVNFGNFDNALPSTFFKNLCNSSRYEALGLYVANVFNRLGERAAKRLELKVLRAIIDVQDEELQANH